MFETFQTLPPMLRTYWLIALAASLVFIIQTIMTFVGADTDAPDMDAGSLDTPGDAPGLFTFKNLINFLLGYGWSGVCFYGRIESMLWLNLLNVGVGLLFVLVFFLLITSILKLAKDASFKIEDAVGTVGDVYLRIPASKQGTGKVQVSVKGTVHELDAITAGPQLPTGAKARITRTIDANTVEVEGC